VRRVSSVEVNVKEIKLTVLWLNIKMKLCLIKNLSRLQNLDLKIRGGMKILNPKK
jgi:hypothetical protein